MVLLVWVYYSSQVVPLGAEFTRYYVERFHGSRAARYATKDRRRPASGAERVKPCARLRRRDEAPAGRLAISADSKPSQR